MLNTGPDLPAYRDAVADLLLEMAGYTGPGDRGKAEKVLTERIGDAELIEALRSCHLSGTVSRLGWLVCPSRIRHTF